MSEKFTAEMHITDNKSLNRLELVIPKGYLAKDLAKVTLGDLISKFRPSGCGACLSGQHLIIREQFERVLPVEIGTGLAQVGLQNGR